MKKIAAILIGAGLLADDKGPRAFVHGVVQGVRLGRLVLRHESLADGHLGADLVCRPWGLGELAVVFGRPVIGAVGHQQVAHDFRGLEEVEAVGVLGHKADHHPPGVDHQGPGKEERVPADHPGR